MEELFTRRSIREYSDKVISDQDLEELLESALVSPSARNQQPQEFILVKNKDMINILSNMSAHSSFIKNAYALVIVLSKPLDILSTPDMMPQDLALACSNIMTYARHKEIGSCYLGVYPREDRMNYLIEKLDIKDGYIPFSIISLGYPKKSDSFKLVKRDLSKVLHKEKF